MQSLYSLTSSVLSPLPRGFTGHVAPLSWPLAALPGQFLASSGRPLGVVVALALRLMKSRPASALSLRTARIGLLRFSRRVRRRILDGFHFERSEQRRQIDHFVRSRSQRVPEILRNRGHFHADAASPQLDCEISKIGVAGYKNNNIRPHLHGELERVDCHHYVNVSLVTALFGRRTVFGYDHESVGAQPLDELVLFVSLFLPDWNRRGKPGIDHHLDQVTCCIWPGQKITELQPIQTAPRRPHRT